MHQAGSEIPRGAWKAEASLMLVGAHHGSMAVFLLSLSLSIRSWAGNTSGIVSGRGGRGANMCDVPLYPTESRLQPDVNRITKNKYPHPPHSKSLLCVM